MLSKTFIDQILLGPLVGMRFTQDSAVLPEVWTAFALGPTRRIPLLITPYRSDAAGPLARRIARRLGNGKNGIGATANRDRRDVAYVDALVAVDLTLDELLRVVLPITSWWEGHARKLGEKLGAQWPADDLITTALGKVLNDPDGGPVEDLVPDDIARIVTLIGLISVEREMPELEESVNSASGRRQILRAAHESILHSEWFHALLEAGHRLREKAVKSDKEGTERVWLVSLNRPVFPAMHESVPAIKADAAMRLFNIDTSGLTWAIIDSGIDATHPAFKTADGQGSRVLEIYDFNLIRSILSIDRIFSPSERETLAAELVRDSGLALQDVSARLDHIARDVDLARVVDWNLVGPLLRRPLNSPPYTDHGTHVAGILAASAAPGSEDPAGVCPQIRLIDLRVMSSTIERTEFAVIAALQFVHFLNATAQYMVVHGVNLSLSIPHDVRNYACGRTPVCEAANRLASNKVVVVAAAGNLGWQPGDGSESAFARYNAISITDPGNAENVITVGATHRSRPHSYGVSYFSSRGPTGDGRSKPDLVAPGEKIRSTLPGNTWGIKDGTSMAAPHVSGAAALLMGRYAELIGEPARIKNILCAKATPLGRERHFQGAGMLDVLRALQEV